MILYFLFRTNIEANETRKEENIFNRKAREMNEVVSSHVWYTHASQKKFETKNTEKKQKKK